MYVLLAQKYNVHDARIMIIQCLLTYFLFSGTPSPHAPFTPAPQYENEFQDIVAPRIPSFNHVEEDHEAKHWFVRRQPRPLNDTFIGNQLKFDRF